MNSRMEYEKARISHMKERAIILALIEKMPFNQSRFKL